VVVEVDVLVGVVVGDCRVVLLVDFDADEVEDELVEDELVEAVVELVSEAVAVCEGWAARAVKRPTPARDPAATSPVAVRVRRNQASRREGVGMPSS
jgi:hypothetical protein